MLLQPTFNKLKHPFSFFHPVSNLVQLEEVDLQENPTFSDLTPSVARWGKLKWINIRNTKFESLPTELLEWTNLVELIIRDNTQLERLPGKRKFRHRKSISFSFLNKMESSK